MSDLEHGPMLRYLLILYLDLTPYSKLVNTRYLFMLYLDLKPYSNT